MDVTPHFPLPIVPMLIFSAMMAGCADEETRWRNAQEENTVSAYEEFLSSFADGAFADSARLGIEAIRFDTATSKGTVAAYEEFLALYPGSVFADSARSGIETIHFDTATSGGSIAALEEFQAMYPEGRFADSVRQVLDSLLPREPQLSRLEVLNAQRDGCRMEFTVSVSHRSGTFGPERPQSSIETRLVGKGTSLRTIYRRVDDVVSDNANHTTLRDTYRRQDYECNGEIRFEVRVTDADGHESNKVQALADFGQGQTSASIIHR